MELQAQGNYQDLRDCFYFFRGLLHKKILTIVISKSDANFVNNTIKKSSNWNTADAHRLYKLVSPYSRKITKEGFNWEKVEEPRLQKKVQQYTQSVARKIESIILKNDKFEVYFNYTSQKLDEIKKIEGRKYEPDNKTWTVPMSKVEDVKKFANNFNIPLSDSVERVLYQFSNNLEQSYQHERVELNIPLKLELYDYQTVGVDYSVRVKRAWIADQMGLGKTPMAIAYAQVINKFPFIIICPKSLRYNWKTEIEDKWTNKKAIIADHKNIKHIKTQIEFGLCDFLIMNYEGAKSFLVLEAKQTGSGYRIKLKSSVMSLFNGVIIDESHELRNIKSKRTKIIQKVCNEYEYRLLLTGSPFVNRVADIATQLRLLGWDEELGGYRQILQDYESDKYVRVRKGTKKKLEELNTKLRSICMIRREKHQVLKQLPDKVRIMVKVDITNRKEYDHAQISLQDYMAANGVSSAKISIAMHAEILTKMMLLKRLAARGKMEAAVQYIQNILDQGEKLVVFCWHLETIEALREHFPQLLEISGNVKDEQVEYNKKLFQDTENKQANLFAITYKRGGTGHTLTAASNFLALELGWNPKDQEQAEDRLHRIGQKYSVTCHYLLGRDTIEEWIYDIIDGKRRSSKKSLNSTEDIDTSVQNQLMNQFVKHEEVENA